MPIVTSSPNRRSTQLVARNRDEHLLRGRIRPIQLHHNTLLLRAEYFHPRLPHQQEVELGFLHWHPNRLWQQRAHHHWQHWRDVLWELQVSQQVHYIVPHPQLAVPLPASLHQFLESSNDDQINIAQIPCHLVKYSMPRANMLLKRKTAEVSMLKWTPWPEETQNLIRLSQLHMFWGRTWKLLRISQSGFQYWKIQFRWT